MTAESRLGPSEATGHEGLEHLVRRYLGAFGPASLKDAANWAGLPPRALAPAVGRMRLQRFLDEAGAELLDLLRAPLPDPETPAPQRFRPRGRRLLVDGQAAGIWKLDHGRVKLEPFERLSREARKQIDDEAERLAEFLS